MKRCERKILKGIKCDEISKNIRWMVRWDLDVERNCQFVHSYSNEPSSMQKKVIVLLSENFIFVSPCWFGYGNFPSSFLDDRRES